MKNRIFHALLLSLLPVALILIIPFLQSWGPTFLPAWEKVYLHWVGHPAIQPKLFWIFIIPDIWEFFLLRAWYRSPSLRSGIKLVFCTVIFYGPLSNLLNFGGLLLR